MDARLPEGTVTILFTDAEDSTPLTNRLGDAAARALLRAAEDTVREQLQRHHGVEVKGTGDGLMLAFQSARRAVHCAVDIQRALARGGPGRPRLRIGLHTGDVIREDADLFGAAVNLAARVAGQAAPGQVLLSGTTASILGPAPGVLLTDRGPHALKGFADPIHLFEARPLPDEHPVPTGRSPFVGRAVEMARLRAALDRARAGQGGLMMLVGEPGIGKSRTIQELAAGARRDGVTVLVGRCYEGEWAPSYSPFVEAISAHVRAADPATLHDDLGYGAAPLSRLVPSLREILPGLAEPASLQPGEEHHRILDAVSQLFLALSRRAPLLLVLDDLHWADAGTLAMLRHTAMAARGERLLVLGTYRDVELGRQHPLAEALRHLRREAEYERVHLKGLATAEISLLLAGLAEHELPASVIAAVEAETDGNPFFVREVLLHLVETGKLRHADGAWRADLRPEDLGIPEGIREVVGLRLTRLSGTANTLLSTASAFNGTFRFGVVARAAGIAELEALDALDEALDAQLVQPAGSPETYEFSHSNIRHVLYGELSPSRQVRLHRTLAETLEDLAGSHAGEHAADIAYHYHRSTALPGAERGVGFALEAAGQARARYAWDQVVTYLERAVEMLPPDDARRSRLLARLAAALPWTHRGDEASAAATEAARNLADEEGGLAAAAYLLEVCEALLEAGYRNLVTPLARAGLAYYRGHERDGRWVRLQWHDLYGRSAGDPDGIGAASDAPERQEMVRVAWSLPRDERPEPWLWDLWRPSSREEALRIAEGTDTPPIAHRIAVLRSNHYSTGLALTRQQAEEDERQGRIQRALVYVAWASRYASALGELALARDLYRHARQLLPRTPGHGDAVTVVGAAGDVLRIALGHPPRDDDPPRWERFLAESDYRGDFGSVRASLASSYAQLGERDQALRHLPGLVSTIRRADRWALSFDFMLWYAVDALWRLDHPEYAALLRQKIEEETIRPDLGTWPMTNGRLEIARLFALERRMEEAAAWFAGARRELEAQGARTLRAVCDYDEALAMHRAGSSDRAAITSLLDDAEREMIAIGMPGWLRDVAALRTAV